MLHRLRRHPLPIAARFRHSLVLAYAFPRAVLEPLLPPGLVLDVRGEDGFAAVALVFVERLRPAFLPSAFGRAFFLGGYRLFVRLEEAESLRGLYILRSDTDSRLMAALGNRLTHYRYRVAQVEAREAAGRLEVAVSTPGGEADLDVAADLASKPAPLPPGSPFANAHEARRYAGPLPYTFDHERETGRIVAVRAVRADWDPQPVAVDVRRAAFFERGPFAGLQPTLANAFHVAAAEYRWERGRLV